MHDSIATNISIKDKTLIIEYDNLEYEQSPNCKYKKLTIEYIIDSYCDAKLYKKNFYKYIDLLENNKLFNKLTRNCSFRSFKYAIDSFNELTLFFYIQGKNKYWNFEINTDATQITYNWE